MLSIEAMSGILIKKPSANPMPNEKLPREFAEKSSRIISALEVFFMKLDFLKKQRRKLLEAIIKRGDKQRIDEIRKSL